MKKWLSRIMMGMVLTTILCAAVAYWAVQQSKQVPEFYTRATNDLPVDLAAASEMLEQDVEQLQDSALRLGSWQAIFTDEQINAWFVQNFDKEFPRVLPTGVEEPRIVIEDGQVLAAARYKNSHIDTVVSFEVIIELTQHANVLAIRIENLRAGSLRLPLQSFLRGITREAAKGGINVVWDQDDRGPVALITVPSEHPKYQKSPVIVESVALQNGCVLLAGHTGPEAWQSYRPRTPVYLLASARVGKKDQFHGGSPASQEARETVR